MSLNKNRAEENSKWHSILRVCINLGDVYNMKNEMIKIFDEFSQRGGDKYIGSIEQIADKFDSLSGKGYIGLFWFWLKEDNPVVRKECLKSYFKLCPPPNDEIAKYIINLIYKDINDDCFSDETVAKAFIKLMDGNVKTVDDFGNGYQWNEQTVLWESKTAKAIMRNITKLDVYYEKVIYKIASAMSEETDAKLKKVLMVKMKKLQQARQKYKGARGLKDAYYIASVDLEDNEFEKLLNVKHHLLPTKNNKVVNLKTGHERARTRSDMFSFECPVELMPFQVDQFKLVDKYMRTTFCENENLIKYMQERFGTFLTGESLREIEVWHGIGKNGKTTMGEILHRILGIGKFYNTINKAVFIEDPKSHKATGQTHTSHLIPLIGMRLCMTSEIKKGDEFNTTMLKGLTGGDPITYRKAYAPNEETFVSYAKFVLLTNPKPQFDFEDKALIDRLRYIPFSARFVEEPNPERKDEYLADKEFIEEIKSEVQINQFFTYMVQGAVRYYERGRKFNTPKIVLAYAKTCLANADRVSRFIDDCCDTKNDDEIKEIDLIDRGSWVTPVNVLNEKFRIYLDNNGDVDPKRGELTKQLKVMGFDYKYSGCGKFSWIKIKNDDE
jgi:P4 family phage/plasmid primase-like protien